MIKAESWTYASGRVAALEGALLGAEALERLAGADSPAAAAAALAESPLRAVAAEAGSPAEAARAVAAHYAALLGSLQAGCPSGELFALVSLGERYRELKERARAALAQARPGGDSPAAVAELLAGQFPPDGPAAAGLALALAALAEPDPPAAGLALDLALDSARLLDAAGLAAALGDPGVGEHVRGEIAVRSVLVVWRARLIAGDDPGSALGRWLPRLFLRGELGAGLAGRMWAAPPAAWGRSVIEELSPALGEALGAGEPERLNPWEKAAFDWLTARVRPMRGAAFGPGRVWGFAWALAVEERNLRLALVGRLRGLAPEAVRALTWEPCCG